MYKNEKEFLKELIVIVRTLGFLLTTAFFGVAGFLVSHFHTISQIQFRMSVAGLLFLFVFLVSAVFYLAKILGAFRRYHG